MATAVPFAVPERPAESGLDWVDLQEVPCFVAAEVPVREFAIRDLLLLDVGTVVNSKEKVQGRIGLKANGSPIARAEFAVADDRLAVRLTELE